MYTIIITYNDGTTEQRECFGRIQAYAIYYAAKRMPEVRDVKIKGVEM